MVHKSLVFSSEKLPKRQHEGGKKRKNFFLGANSLLKKIAKNYPLVGGGGRGVLP